MYVRTLKTREVHQAKDRFDVDSDFVQTKCGITINYGALSDMPLKETIEYWNTDNEDVCRECGIEGFNSDKDVNKVADKLLAANTFGGSKRIETDSAIDSLIEKAYKLGYQHGCSNRSFNPYDHVKTPNTAEEIKAMLKK